MAEPGWSRRRKTDEERKASGSFRPSRGDEARARRIASNIYAGPGYQDVPDPEFDLSPYGVRKYFELAGRLLKEGKLSAATRETAEQIAMLKERQHSDMRTRGRTPAYIARDIMRLLAMLKLAEDTTPIGGNVGSDQEENPFDICGALLAPFAPSGLRRSAAPPA